MKSIIAILGSLILTSFIFYSCESENPTPVVNVYDTTYVNIADSSVVNNNFHSSSAAWIELQAVYPDSIDDLITASFDSYSGPSPYLEFYYNHEPSFYMKLLENTYTIIYSRKLPGYPFSIPILLTMQVFAGDTTVVILP